MSKKKQELINIISSFTGIPNFILEDFVNKNSFSTLFEHPYAINVSNEQVQRLKRLSKFRHLYSNQIYHDNKYKLDNYYKSKQYFKYFFGDMREKELFVCAFLDINDNIIKTKIISEGTIDQATVYSRELIKQTLLNNASSVLFAHNHPGGASWPSQKDIELTYIMMESLSAINVPLKDHIIVGEKSISMVEQNYFIPTSISPDERYITLAPTDNNQYRYDRNRIVQLISDFTEIPKSKLHDFLEIGKLSDLINNPSALKGIDSKSKTKLLLLGDFRRSYIQQNDKERKPLNSSIRAKEFFSAFFSTTNITDQKLVLAFLDKQNNYISAEQIYSGNLQDIDSINKRTIIERCLYYDSSSVLIGYHKDPGNSFPEYHDIYCNTLLKNLLATVGIQVQDFVIVGEHNCYSLGEVSKSASLSGIKPRKTKELFELAITKAKAHNSNIDKNKTQKKEIDYFR